MKVTVLVDNILTENLKGEWGLSIFIKYEDRWDNIEEFFK